MIILTIHFNTSLIMHLSFVKTSYSVMMVVILVIMVIDTMSRFKMLIYVNV